MELHVPTSGSPEKSLDPLEFLRPGYVQLHVAGNDIVDVFAKSRNGRPRLVLESLHRPYNQEQKRVKPPLKLNDISQCTKLHFVVRILNKIKALDMVSVYTCKIH
jgi:hypothetical protein